MSSSCLHHLDLSLNCEGCWSTTDDFFPVPSILYFTAHWDLVNSRPVHSLMSSHLFFCLPCLPPPFIVPYRTQKLKSYLVRTQLKRSPFKAWSKSVYSLTCYAYCKRFLPCLFLPFRSIHLHFFKKPSRFFLCWLRLTHGSCVGPQNKIGHPAGCRFPCWVPAEYK